MSGVIADRLASVTARARGAGDPASRAARRVFLDTLGVMTAGSARPEHSRLRELVARGTGAATVIGSPHGSSPSDAVFLNGTTPTVYQLDEGYRVSRGHPGIHVVPAVWALAEDLGSSAAEMFTALLAGYEVAARVGRGFGGVVADIHPHGNWGAVGAAAGAAFLWSGGDASAIAAAVDLSASVALSPDRRATTLGAGAHHLFAAGGAQLGFLSAAAVMSGMTAVRGSLEDFLMRRSAANPNPALIVAEAADGRWAVEDAYIKFWPSCAHTHTAVGATLDLMGRHPLDPRRIERIEIQAFRAAADLRQQDADTELAARFSIPYAVATAIVRGGFPYDALDGETVHRPDVRELAGRVSVLHDPALDADYPDSGRPLTMTVVLTDGSRISAEAWLSHGDQEDPASPEEVRDKAAALIRLRFGETGAGPVLEAIEAVLDGEELSRLGDAFRAASAA